MSIYTYKAYGKVNLALDVVRKRDDGYHDLKMIMQKISIFDTLKFEITNTPEIQIICDVEISNLEDNLIYKAIKKLFELKNITNKGVTVYLEKNIPMEAGLGGGSSDCATTLVAINEIFNFNIPKEKLIEIAKSLGADVPFCLFGSTMVAEGIGEILTPIHNHPKCYYVIAKPNINVNTASVFKSLNINDLKKKNNFDDILKAFKNKDLNLICENLYNDLEIVTITQYPKINEVKNLIKENGAINTLMAGSGSTVFGIFDNENTAKKCIDTLTENEIDFQKIQLCTPINY